MSTVRQGTVEADRSGLLEACFIACPHWQSNNKDCAFVTKLKSDFQLALLFKAETGMGSL